MLHRATGPSRPAQPDRPALIMLGHASVPVLYLTHSAVSPVRFTNDATRALIASPFLLPLLHISAAVLLLAAIVRFRRPWHRAAASVYSVLIWVFTTALLTQASYAHSPRGTLWAADMAMITTLASIMMATKWGVREADDDEVS